MSTAEALREQAPQGAAHEATQGATQGVTQEGSAKKSKHQPTMVETWQK
jgi:hypothetical protein